MAYIPDLFSRASNTNGTPESGAKRLVYQAGTTTPVTTYSDRALATAQAFPVVANSGGVFATSYVPSGSYKIRITDADDNLLIERDHIRVADRPDDPVFLGDEAAVLADTDTYAAGTYIYSSKDGIRFEALASGATVFTDTNAGGQKLLRAAPVYATRAVLKQARPLGSVYLTEAGREGYFVFRVGDYSAQVTADTAEGVYMASDNVASSSGAWVRDYSDHLRCEWFGAKAESSFDNGPALRAACSMAEYLGSSSAAMPLVIGSGTFEVNTAESGSTSAIRFQKAPNITGAGLLSTIFEWSTSTQDRPFMLLNPSTATAVWGPELKGFQIKAREGAAAGTGIKFDITSPSAIFGGVIDRVRVVGCYDGIAFNNVSGTTIYGTVIKNCSVENVISGGKGFNISGAYLEIDNCEAYPSFDGTGETSYTFYMTSGWSRFSNLRAAGPVYADAAFSEIDITIEGQGSSCAHNGSSAVRINRMKKIKCNLLGARITANSTPRYGLNLQDSGYIIEQLSVQDISGFSSPITPLVGPASGRSTLVLAQASGSGVLKPENDIETGLDPTSSGRLQVLNGGTWTDYGEWSVTYNPPSIGAGASTTTTVSCGGLRNSKTPVGASFSIQHADIDVSAKYLSATVVQVRFTNHGAGAVDLDEGTLTVRVLGGSVP